MRRPQVSPVVLVLLAVGSVQFGGALAATLIPAVGALGSVTLRLAIAAAVMLAVLRPRVRGYDAGDWATVAGFAVALASMNAAFYASLSRLPIGAAVTIEFVGPLLLAAVLSRLAKDFVAVAVAALGVVLVSGVIGTSTERLDPVGVVLALLAGASWAAYILLSARTGRRFPKLDGLALAMVIATLIVAPVGVVTAGPRLWHVDILLQGAAIAMLSSVIPYSLELLALRRMHAAVFGVLLSLEPAVAAVAGFLVLGQRLTGTQLVGLTAVVLASAAVTRRTEPAPPEP